MAAAMFLCDARMPRSPHAQSIAAAAMCLGGESVSAGGGTLTNIRADGSASMGWHGDPDLLHRDAFKQAMEDDRYPELLNVCCAGLQALIKGTKLRLGQATSRAIK